MQTRHSRRRPLCAPTNNFLPRIAQSISLHSLATLLFEQHVNELEQSGTCQDCAPFGNSTPPFDNSTAPFGTSAPPSASSTVLVRLDEFTLLGPGPNPGLVSGVLSGTRERLASAEEILGQHSPQETVLAALLTSEEAVIAATTGAVARVRRRPQPTALKAVARDSPAMEGSAMESSGGGACLQSDLLLRYLGCNTSPEATEPRVLGMRQWLTLAVSTAAEPPARNSINRSAGPPDWTTLAALHPSFTGTADPKLLGAQALADTAGWTWEELRVATARGDAVIAEASEREATWMDAGSFARWLLSSYETVTCLLEDLRYFVDEYCHQQVVATLRASGWLGFE